MTDEDLSRPEGHPEEAVVLCGGLGTRLRAAVPDRPKPMSEVRGRPFLEWLLRWLAAGGVRRAVLATGYLGDSIEEHFGSGASLGIAIDYSRELEPLGTAGAVALAAGQCGRQPMLVLNGDSFTPADLTRLWTGHRQRRARATIWTVPADAVSRFGALSIDGGGSVTSFVEKPGSRDAAGVGGLVSAGIYVLEPDVVAEMPANRPLSLEADVFPGLVGRGMYAAQGEPPLVDIGTVESYATVERALGAQLDRISVS